MHSYFSKIQVNFKRFGLIPIDRFVLHGYCVREYAIWLQGTRLKFAREMSCAKLTNQQRAHIGPPQTCCLSIAWYACPQDTQLVLCRRLAMTQTWQLVWNCALAHNVTYTQARATVKLTSNFNCTRKPGIIQSPILINWHPSFQRTFYVTHKTHRSNNGKYSRRTDAGLCVLTFLQFLGCNWLELSTKYLSLFAEYFKWCWENKMPCNHHREFTCWLLTKDIWFRKICCMLQWISYEATFSDVFTRFVKTI